MRPYRKGVGFVMDELSAYTRLERNERARILAGVEALELATKRKGCRNGVVTQPGVAVLRALLFKFHNPQNGRCCPGYEALGAAAGLCRASVAKGVAALERLGVLRVTRRLVRFRDTLGVIAVRQGSNLYGFKALGRLTALGGFFVGSRKNPRVYRMNRNQEPHYIEPTQPGRKWLCDADWRERARRALGIAK